MTNKIPRFFAAAVLAASALSAQSKLAVDLRPAATPSAISGGNQTNATTDGGNGSTTVTYTTVIVQFTGAPAASDLASVTANGGTLIATLPAANAALYSLPSASIKALNTNDSVKYATPDRKLYRHLEYAEPAVNANVALKYGYDGTGVGIAVVDSGVATTHADLQKTSGGARWCTARASCRAILPRAMPTGTVHTWPASSAAMPNPVPALEPSTHSWGSLPTPTWSTSGCWMRTAPRPTARTSPPSTAPSRSSGGTTSGCRTSRSGGR